MSSEPSFESGLQKQFQNYTAAERVEIQQYLLEWDEGRDIDSMCQQSIEKGMSF